MEDFVTWTDTSKIRKHVLDYNEEVGKKYAAVRFTYLG